MGINLQNEVLLRSVKILDIGFITLIYFILGILFAKIYDNLYGRFDDKKEKEKTFFVRTLELVGMIWACGVTIYIVKNIVELIPSPFNGFVGFDHLLMKELKNATVFTFIFLFSQVHLKNKISLYYNNLPLL